MSNVWDMQAFGQKKLFFVGYANFHTDKSTQLSAWLHAHVA
jgi:hypothetical protein